MNCSVAMKSILQFLAKYFINKGKVLISFNPVGTWDFILLFFYVKLRFPTLVFSDSSVLNLAKVKILALKIGNNKGRNFISSRKFKQQGLVSVICVSCLLYSVYRYLYVKGRLPSSQTNWILFDSFFPSLRHQTVSKVLLSVRVIRDVHWKKKSKSLLQLWHSKFIHMRKHIKWLHCARAHTHTHTHTHKHAHTHTCMHARTHAHTHTHTHAV
jgi:hypothetical protein